MCINDAIFAAFLLLSMGFSLHTYIYVITEGKKRSGKKYFAEDKLNSPHADMLICVHNIMSLFVSRNFFVCVSFKEGKCEDVL